VSLIISIGLLVAGLAFLIKGADWLVDGASGLARIIGMSELAIGLTIVSFGTSMPEFLVNIIASMQGNSDMAIGNIVGSNIANTLLILGLSTLFGTLIVRSSTVRNEIPFSLLAALVLFVVLNDVMIDGVDSLRILTRSEGIILLLFFIIFLYYTFSLRREDMGDGSDGSMSFLAAMGYILLGGIMLPVGGKFVVDSATNLASFFGVSQAFIGLSLVALGTSLPEIFTSCVAVRKGKADIAVGNVVGSNIFNIFWIMGISAIIRPIPLNTNLNIDLIVVIIAALLLFILVQRGPVHKRPLLIFRKQPEYNLLKSEGVFLLAGYAGYFLFIGLRG